MSNIRTSLAIPIDPWERAKSRFLEGLSDEERSSFQSATLETIYYQAEVVHRGHQQTSKLNKCRQKLRPLLNALEAYGSGLDVISNTGTVSMVMAPLWGSIRVALQIAQDSTEMFEKIVDMFTEIGNALPHFRDYERLFPEHESLLVAISDAYLTIIYFCTDIKDLFGDAKKSKTSKISLKLACKSAWKPFTEKFHRYLRDFKELQSRIDTEAGKADMIEAKQERQRHEAHRKALILSNKKERLQESLRRISPYDYKGHHRRIQELRHPGTAIWLFDLQPFKEWLFTPSSSIFGCFGIPGSGKTILSSSVMEHLQSTQESSVVFYHYCSYEYPSSLKATAILGTFLRQLLERETLFAGAESLHEDLLDKLNTPIPKELFAAIARYFKSGDTYVFLIDGVDELPSSEQAELAVVLEKAVSDALHCTVKVYISCRPEAVVKKKAFDPNLSVTISPENLSQDIISFVEAKVDEKLKEGDLELGDPHLRDEIIDRLAAGAKGMYVTKPFDQSMKPLMMSRFLWVKFQIDEICEAVSDEGIRKTLADLPRDLVSTYARIIQRISASPGGPSKLEILGKTCRWLICAKRPLTMEELKVAIALEITDTSMPTARISSGDGSRIIRACNNLVVLSRADRIVHLAHHTVRQFILLADDVLSDFTSTPSDDDPMISTEAGKISRTAYMRSSEKVHFNLEDADREIGALCLTFLNFGEFQTEIEVREADHTTLHTTGSIVSGLLQTMIPSSGILRQSLASFGGIRGVDHSKKVTLVLPKAKQSDTAQKTVFDHYPLLQYISSYWPFHLDHFDGPPLIGPGADNRYPRIHNMALDVAFRKTFLFQARPWETQEYTKVELEQQHVSPPAHLPFFRWALEHGSEYLWFHFLRLLEKSDDQKSSKLAAYMRFEMQPYSKERDVIVRAASGGSIDILCSLIGCLEDDFGGIIPLDVLCHTIAVSSDTTLESIFKSLDACDIRIARGQPEPERKFFWQSKSEEPVSWLERTWSADHLVHGPDNIMDLVLDHATKEGDWEVHRKANKLIHHPP
ncbi:nacht domain protein [Diplodia corticola]|uniref:Nacht domain protein n=1 Tax=Diplodia corticola TaxID=236234 RepID=A0A1J9QNU4_9PEZI|nr:nacht domain protein [Diplodia corticola]OJD30121.1 nacht domain protein [Diplodia corticola]